MSPLLTILHEAGFDKNMRVIVFQTPQTPPWLATLRFIRLSKLEFWVLRGCLATREAQLHHCGLGSNSEHSSPEAIYLFHCMFASCMCQSLSVLTSVTPLEQKMWPYETSVFTLSVRHSLLWITSRGTSALNSRQWRGWCTPISVLLKWLPNLWVDRVAIGIAYGASPAQLRQNKMNGSGHRAMTS